ncbi:MAG TPA: hypothetical protein VN673_02570 [Clostridia bacterium]|nr:hypothetical protein [Clostridia bacterium]
MIIKALIWVLCLAPFLASASTLELYRELSGKTLLVAPALPQVTDFAVSDLPVDKTNAIATIEDELAKSGIAIVPDGPHFIRLLPVKQREGFLKEAPLRGQELSASARDEIVPSGALNFQGTDLSQVLAIYAELSRRTVLRPSAFVYPLIHLKTSCPLSRQEVVYALDTVLALNGIATIEDGGSFVQMVPINQRFQVKLQAPQREPNAKLLDPKKLPTLGGPRVAPASKLEREFLQLQTAFYQFINYKGPPLRPAFRLLELHAQLTSKKAVPSKQFDGMPVFFRVQTPLSKSELLYAIETTLKLNNLGIVSGADQTIRLGHIRELGKNAGKQDANLHRKN